MRQHVLRCAYITITGVALVALAPSALISAPPDAPVALLRGVEDARLRLPPSKLDMVLEFESPTVNSNDRFDVLFSGDKRRFRQHVDAGGPITSIFDGRQAMLSDGGSGTICDMAQPSLHYLFDPRTLGITATYVSDDTVQSALGYHNAKSVSLVGPEMVDGKRTWHVHVIDSYNQNKDFWIEPGPGFPVLRHEFSTKTQRNITTSQYYSNIGSNLIKYLPRRVQTEAYVNGKLRYKRKISIRRTESGISIDPSIWTIAGLELPVGAPVTDLRIHRRIGYWNGRELSTSDVPPAAGRPSRP